MKTNRQPTIRRVSAQSVLALLLTAAVTVRANYQSTILADTPLAYYPLDIAIDPTGTTATDLSGNSNNGTYNGSSPQYNTVPGPSATIPNALQFDGASDFVDLSTGANPSLLNFSGPISVEAWAQPADSTSFGDIIGKGYDSSTYQEIAIRVNGPYGANYFATSGSKSVSGGQQNTNWVHVVMVNDGTNTTLYLDGEAVQSVADTTGAVNFSDPWAIGDGTSSGASRFFNGNICQVAIYNHGLSASAVFDHYFVGKYGVAPASSIPIITGQPTAQVSYTNGTAVFSVNVLGVLAVTNQWYKDGSPLAGQTNALLVLSNLQPADAGSYTVTVGNSNGSTNSTAAALTLANISAYERTVIADAPLAYYPLDNSIDSAPLAQDLSGNGNFGYYVNLDPAANGAAGPSAYIPNAVTFNGSSTWVDLSPGNQPGLLNFAGPIAMEAWVEPADSTSFGDIVAKGYDASSYQEIVIRVNGPYGANYYANSGSGGVSGGQQGPVWTHVVLSSDGSHCNLYINGVLAQSTADSGGSQIFSDAWAIGDGTSAGSGRYFNGNICQVAIYDHPLTTNQILQHYFMGSLGKATSNAIPVIFAQPQSQSVYAGATATFSVGVLSTLPVTNLWFRDGIALPGQTNSTLVVSNVQSPASFSVVVGNSVGTTNSASASLTLLAAGNSLVWTSTNNSGIWDSGTSPNWVNVSNSQQVVFNTGDKVLFDDTPSVPTSVTVSGSVAPSSIIVDSDTNAFTFNDGPGSITGAGGLLKEGASTLTILCSGNFTGPVTVQGGDIYAGNNCFASAGSFTITNDATLDLAGGTFNTGQAITVSGAGQGGLGAVVNSYSDDPLDVFNIRLAGDATFGGSARWDLGNGSSLSGPHTLTLDWSADTSNPYSEMTSPTVGADVTGIIITNASKLGAKNMDSSFANPGTVVTLTTNSQLIFWSGGWNGSLHVYGGAQVYMWTAPAAFNGSTVTLEDSAQWLSWGGSGNEPINSAMVLNGIAHVVVGDHNMVYTNIISGPGGFVMDVYNHAMILSAVNTYQGPTVINDGPQVALTGNGSIAQSSLIFFGGSNPNSTHLDVSGRTDNTLTLAAGQTLGGIGAVNGNLVVSPGAVLTPGGTNTLIGITTGASPTGMVSAAGITLRGTTTIKLNGPGLNDALQASGNISYGGTLNLVNISGSPLALGNSFQVFNGASYSDSFANIVPATPGPGLAWQLSNGKISVVVAQPAVNRVKVQSGQLVFSGTGGTSSGTYYVLTATNLANPAWVPVATNQYDASGDFSVTNTIDAAGGQRYFRLQQ